MKKLKRDLPETFKITKQIMGVGMMQFDSTKVRPEDYEKWSKLGFADLFEEVELAVEVEKGELEGWIEEKIEDTKVKSTRVSKKSSK